MSGTTQAMPAPGNLNYLGLSALNADLQVRVPDGCQLSTVPNQMSNPQHILPSQSLANQPTTHLPSQ